MSTNGAGSANIAAGLQHELTRTAGARPFGCTCVIVGVDTSFDDHLPGVVRLFQSEPGGIVEECHYCAAGKNAASAWAALEQLFFDKVSNSNDDTTSVLQSVCSGVVNAALSENSQGGQGSADLWILRSDPNRRGKQHLLCVRKVDQSSAKEVASLIAS
eukprot:CAMPEP_0116541294 /NCGR_PEP_ID=MMETSP0397-20121206/405_1 /TAXON_ID=216820 /ORGANISM="Cyclophora tenuis, Strain ECT3854" /LENGTH=158 /DNA_ID=CAMNT_0004065225 /DNA_START=104 /DNA_END=578 /DNA_ORIENTATION=+